MASKKTTNSAIRKRMTRAQVLTDLADATGVTKKEVKAVLDRLGELAARHLKKGGAGEFVVPGVDVKVRAIKKPATKARKGRNPFTGEEIMVKAKPARLDVRARALKSLKEAVAGDA